LHSIGKSAIPLRQKKDFVTINKEMHPSEKKAHQNVCDVSRKTLPYPD